MLQETVKGIFSAPQSHKTHKRIINDSHKHHIMRPIATMKYIYSTCANRFSHQSMIGALSANPTAKALDLLQAPNRNQSEWGAERDAKAVQRSFRFLEFQQKSFSCQYTIHIMTTKMTSSKTVINRPIRSGGWFFALLRFRSSVATTVPGAHRFTTRTQLEVLVHRLFGQLHPRRVNDGLRRSTDRGPAVVTRVRILHWRTAV